MASLRENSQVPDRSSLRFWENHFDAHIEKFKMKYEASAATATNPLASQVQTKTRRFFNCIWDKLLPDRKFFFKQDLTLRDIQEMEVVKKMAPTVAELRGQIGILEEDLKQHKQPGKAGQSLGGVGWFRKILDGVVATELRKIRIGYFLLMLANILAASLYIITMQISHWPSLLIGSINLVVAFFCLIMIVIRAYILGLENKVRLKQSMALRLLIYDRLMVTDSQLLDMYDNNIIYKLLYKETDDYTNLPYWCWYPLLCLDLVIIGALINTIREIWFGGSALFGLAHIPLVILHLRNWPHLQQLKRAIINKRKLILETLNSYKDSRFLGLGQFCSNRISIVSRAQLLIKLAVVRNNTIIAFIQKSYGPLVTLLQEMLFWSGWTPSTQKQYNNQMLPPTRLVFFYIWFLIDQYLETLRIQSAAYVDKQSAGELLDKFFATDVLIETDQVKEDDSQPGAVIISGAQMYDRIPENFTEVIDFLLAKDKAKLTEAPQLRPQQSMRPKPTDTGKIEGKKKGAILARVHNRAHSSKELDRMASNVQDSKLLYSNTLLFQNERGSLKVSGTLGPTGETDLRRSFTKAPLQAKLRRIFSDISVHISPGDKVCIIEDKSRDAVSYFLRMIMGGGFITQGSVLRGGKCVHLNLNNPCFLVGETIRNNIIFGRGYDRLRYESTLKPIGLNLNAYPGRDYHQIGENAHNISVRDQILILIARMLYSEADILIIEDLLRDPEQLVLLPLLRGLFSGILKAKTVIYNTRLLPLVSLGTQLLKFTRNKLLKQIPVKEFKAKYFQKYKTDLDDPKHEGGFKGKRLQNCFFPNNADFREELMIQKDMESHRALVDRMKTENPNLVEQVLSGVLLVQRAMTRGKVILDQIRKRLTLWETCTVMFANPASRVSQLYLYTVLSFCKSAALYVHIFLNTFIFRLFSRKLPQNYFFGEAPGVEGPFSTTYLSENDTSKAYLITIISIMVYISLDAATIWYSRKILWNKIERESSRSGNWFMDMSYSFIESNFFHVLVDRFSSDPFTMNFEVFPRYILMVDLVAEYLCIAITLIILLSVWPSIVIQTTFLWIFFKVVYPSRIGYSKLQELKDSYQSRLDQLHYQLLNLIGEYRLSNQLGIIRSRLEGLQNNLSMLVTADQLIYRKTVLVIMIGMVTLLALMIFSVRLLILGLPSAFYLKGSDPIAYLNLFMYLRQIWVLWQLITTFYAVQEKTLAISRLADFNNKMIKEQQELGSTGLHKFWRQEKFENDAPLVFKHVSVTIGYRPVLKNVNFQLPRRSKTAIVGTDWIGRSAVFQVIMGANLPDGLRRNLNFLGNQQYRVQKKTSIKIFGVEQQFMSKSLYSQLMHINRNAHLLEGSVRSNIDPYCKSEDTNILEIAEQFGLEEILFRLQPEEDLLVLNPEDPRDEESIKSSGIQLEADHLGKQFGQPLPEPLLAQTARNSAAPNEFINPDTARNAPSELNKQSDHCTSLQRMQLPPTTAPPELLLQPVRSQDRRSSQQPVSLIALSELRLGVPGANLADGFLRANSSNAQIGDMKSSKDGELLNPSALKLQLMKSLEQQHSAEKVGGGFHKLQALMLKDPKQFSSVRKVEKQAEVATVQPLKSQKEIQRRNKGTGFLDDTNHSARWIDSRHSKQSISVKLNAPIEQISESGVQSQLGTLNKASPSLVSEGEAELASIKKSHNKLGQSSVPQVSPSLNSQKGEDVSRVEMGGLYLVQIARMESREQEPVSAVQEHTPQQEDHRSNVVEELVFSQSDEGALKISHLSSMFEEEQPASPRVQDPPHYDEDSESDGPP